MNRVLCGNYFPYSTLFNLVTDDKFWAKHSADQQARIISALILSTTFANLGNYYYFSYLVNLVALDRVKALSWGVPAYLTLIVVCELGCEKLKRLAGNIILACLWMIYGG